MTDQTPKTNPSPQATVTGMSTDLTIEAGRLAAWVYAAALPASGARELSAEVLTHILAAKDPGPVTVEILPMYDDTRASWLKEPGDEPDPGAWLSTLPADRAALFHLCSKVMDEILREAVEASPRDFDGDYRAACASYQHVSAPARDRWHLEIQWDDPLKRETRLAEFDTAEEADEALAAVTPNEDRVLLVHGRLVRLSEAGGRLAIRHDHTDAYEGESCATCHYPKDWHEVEA